MNCSKCGAGVPQGAAFCPMCGTPVVPAVPAAPVPTPPPAPSPAQAAAPAPKAKMPIWGIILIIAACIILLIPVLGIFAGIILASLGSARTQSGDAMTKAVLVSFRSAGEIYNIKTGSYGGFCTDPQTKELTYADGDPSRKFIETYVCNDSQKQWAASAPLHSGTFWCVDSEGTAQETRTSVAAETLCPAN